MGNLLLLFHFSIAFVGKVTPNSIAKWILYKINNYYMQIIFQIILISTSLAYLIANYTCDCSFHSEELECTNVATCDWVNEAC